MVICIFRSEGRTENSIDEMFKFLSKNMNAIDLIIRTEEKSSFNARFFFCFHFKRKLNNFGCAANIGNQKYISLVDDRLELRLNQNIFSFSTFSSTFCLLFIFNLPFWSHAHCCAWLPSIPCSFPLRSALLWLCISVYIFEPVIFLRFSHS